MSHLMAYNDHGSMVVAPMMTAMKGNNYHLGHQRLQDCHAGRGKKERKCYETLHLFGFSSLGVGISDATRIP